MGEAAESRRVLVVDDDPQMGELLRVALGGCGFEVSVRSSGEGVAEWVGGGDFDALVTDLRMPGVDGLTLCRQVARDCPHVAVIVMTAFGSRETGLAALRAGAHDFIAKPFLPHVLSELLDRAIRGRRKCGEGVVDPQQPSEPSRS